MSSQAHTPHSGGAVAWVRWSHVCAAVLRMPVCCIFIRVCFSSSAPGLNCSTVHIPLYNWLVLLAVNASATLRPRPVHVRPRRGSEVPGLFSSRNRRAGIFTLRNCVNLHTAQLLQAGLSPVSAHAQSPVHSRISSIFAIHLIGGTDVFERGCAQLKASPSSASGSWPRVAHFERAQVGRTESVISGRQNWRKRTHAA